MINIIFSFNRASQLDNLLDSMFVQNVDVFKYMKTYIIYRHSSENFKLGYDKVINKFSKLPYYIEFINQDCFSKQVLDLVKQSDITGLITDDSLFYKKTSVPNLDGVGVYSTRYGFNTIVQDPFKKTYQPYLRNFVDEKETIKWNSLDHHPLNNYGFLCSMDGHYYRSEDLLKMIDFDFKNPSQLETGLFKRTYLINPWIRSEKQSSLVNIPLNNAGGYTEFVEANLDEINEKYLEGKTIKFLIKDIKGSHQILDWKFV